MQKCLAEILKSAHKGWVSTPIIRKLGQLGMQLVKTWRIPEYNPIFFLCTSFLANFISQD